MTKLVLDYQIHIYKNFLDLVLNVRNMYLVSIILLLSVTGSFIHLDVRNIASTSPLINLFLAGKEEMNPGRFSRQLHIAGLCPNRSLETSLEHLTTHGETLFYQPANSKHSVLSDLALLQNMSC